MSAKLSRELEAAVSYDSIRKYFFDALHTRRYSLIGTAFNYKKSSANYNWLADEVFQPKYGLARPAKFYATIAEVQKDLQAVEGQISFGLIRDIVLRAVIAAGIRDRYSDRYKQLWILDQLITRFNQNYHPDLISWMLDNGRLYDPYVRNIVSDREWVINLNEHHVAFVEALRTFLRATAVGYHLNLSDTLDLAACYQKIQKFVTSECVAPAGLINDAAFIEAFMANEDIYAAVRFNDTATARFAMTKEVCHQLHEVVAAVTKAFQYCAKD